MKQRPSKKADDVNEALLALLTMMRVQKREFPDASAAVAVRKNVDIEALKEAYDRYQIITDELRKKWKESHYGQ